MCECSFPIQQVYHTFLFTKNVPIHFFGSDCFTVFITVWWYQLASFLLSVSTETLAKLNFYFPFLVMMITKVDIV